jgi:hypothetical protein
MFAHPGLWIDKRSRYPKSFKKRPGRREKAVREHHRRAVASGISPCSEKKVLAHSS